MTNIHFISKRTLTVIACLSLSSMLAACGANNGYYDAKGNYISSESPYNAEQDLHYTNPGRTHNEYSAQDDDDNHSEYGRYDRRGYYDRNGDYITTDDGLSVPENMLPPRGMCRVWFARRRASEQPAVESCSSIKSRVSAGAYVIYGG